MYNTKLIFIENRKSNHARMHETEFGGLCLRACLSSEIRLIGSFFFITDSAKCNLIDACINSDIWQFKFADTPHWSPENE